ncbi:hypothetical protein scyTo_0002066 [Scyliorhinus torazame]|uniref:Uncharacterized protein n=1 Tax=Scyliorhinus torazame TaxID=75743 RepID=A0A401PHI3_SCYTO|nr:hypothetical protein [Scyliorhinus torazame]
METPQHRPFQLMLNPRNIKGRRKRRDLFWWQVCWLGGVLLVLLCVSSLVEKAGYYVVRYTSEVDDKWIGRRLMQHSNENITDAKATSHQYKNCTEPDLYIWVRKLRPQNKRADLETSVTSSF